jgi:anti-sigma factor RsiW
MNAEDAEALFSAAYDSELSPEEKAEFDAALAQDVALSARYREFCRTIETLKHADEAVPTPDLLRGVQRRLRVQSGGRFYSDRFAERSGLGTQQLLSVLLGTTLLLLVVWAAFAYLGDVHIVP